MLLVLFATHTFGAARDPRQRPQIHRTEKVRSGSFSSRAVPLTPRDSASAPDGRTSLSVRWIDDDTSDGFAAMLHVETASRRFQRRFEFGLNPEVIWSSDYTRFSLTGSAAGANGQYQTAIVTIAPSGLRWFDVTPPIERTFGHPVRCDWLEVPNVAVTRLARRTSWRNSPANPRAQTLPIQCRMPSVSHGQ
jgi:hypothetical protein